MRMYKETPEGKNWSVKLVEEAGEVKVVAVDTYTGEIVANFINLTAQYVCIGAENALRTKGYDPNEHDTVWGAYGEMMLRSQV